MKNSAEGAEKRNNMGCGKDRPLSIYIHIPFCIQKCLYCDFLSFPADPKAREQYVDALCREIAGESKRYTGYEVNTVFLGGGTPSLLPGRSVEKILDTVRQNYRVKKSSEITLEANPGTVTPEKLFCWQKSGVNRLSIGLQSASDRELKALGRIHASEDFFSTYNLAAKTGFKNINVDLMSAIPGQTLASYADTLKKVTDLKPAPTHISAYSLMVEEGTPFYENTPELPDEETEREMYKITNDFLGAAGYRQYEISNYALPGYECRHNKVYWRRGDYVGFGIGAASLVDNVRFNNTRNLSKYMEFYSNSMEDKDYAGDGGTGGGEPEHKRTYAIYGTEMVKEDLQVLTEEEQMEEFMFLGLRMTEGVSSSDFFDAFGVTMDSVYPGIVDNFCKEGLLMKRKEPKTGGDRVMLTRFGIDVSNVVMAEFLLT